MTILLSSSVIIQFWTLDNMFSSWDNATGEYAYHNNSSSTDAFVLSHIDKHPSLLKGRIRVKSFSSRKCGFY